MKRKDNKRKDSENSDDTLVSQDTTITNVSDNSNSEITKSIETIAEKDEKMDNEKVTFVLGDLTSAVAYNIEIEEKADETYVSLHHEKVNDKATNKALDTPSNQTVNGVNSNHCGVNSNHLSCFPKSHDTEPLLKGEESVKFSRTRNGSKVSQDSKEDKNKKNNADNNVKSITQSYIGLKASYRKIRRVLVVLGILDLILIICVVTVVPTVVITTTYAASPWTTATSRDEDPNGYNICFDCVDLEKDRAFSAETLRGVYRRDGSCCFKSITSVYFSIKQVSY